MRAKKGRQSGALASTEKKTNMRAQESAHSAWRRPAAVDSQEKVHQARIASHRQGGQAPSSSVARAALRH